MNEFVITTKDLYCCASYYRENGYAPNDRFPKGTIFVRSNSEKGAYMLIRNGVVIPNERGTLRYYYDNSITANSIPYTPTPII